MPELPEVETIRRQLSERIVGKKIIGIETPEKKMFLGDKAFAVGKTVKSIGRCAKVLQIIFGDGSALLVHFKMTGQMFWQKKGEHSEARFTRAIITLSDGSRLLFNDARKFGWIKMADDVGAICKKTAIEPLLDNFTLDNFSAVIKKSRRAIKLLLMDQDKIGGIGNIYANEALFLARISPFRIAATLNENEIEKLRLAILKVLAKAIECKGSSGKDEWYRQINGLPGCYQEHFLVYQRQGQKCGGCSGKVVRKKQAGRSSFYCPECQK